MKWVDEQEKTTGGCEFVSIWISCACGLPNSHASIRATMQAGEPLAARKELQHDWLDIKHRCAVDCVKLADKQFGSFHPKDPADGAPNPIRPVLAPLRKDAHSGPSRIVSRMKRAAHDF